MRPSGNASKILHGVTLSNGLNKQAYNWCNDEHSESIGETTGLGKIFSVAGVGRGVFSCGLHFHPVSRRRPVDFWLRVFSRPADRPAHRPPRVLFRAGDGISLLCAATVFLLAHFRPGAIALWLVLAFWVGLFAAIVCGSIRRWGKVKAMWLVPMVWTGLEYFRSELYYLKFSWLNIGYALSDFRFNPFGVLGMYGVGFLVFAIVAVFIIPTFAQANLNWLSVIMLVALLIVLWHSFFSSCCR